MELLSRSKSLFRLDGSIVRRRHLANDATGKQRRVQLRLSRTFLSESCKECSRETRPGQLFENPRVLHRYNLNEVLLLKEQHRLIHAPYTLRWCSVVDQ